MVKYNYLLFKRLFPTAGSFSFVLEVQTTTPTPKPKTEKTLEGHTLESLAQRLVNEVPRVFDLEDNVSNEVITTIPAPIFIPSNNYIDEPLNPDEIIIFYRAYRSGLDNLKGEIEKMKRL